MFLYPASKTLADQSEGFTRKGYYWYDDWGVNRNNAAGDDGYLPAVVYESLGQNVELAHQFGRRFLTEYSDRVTRAEKIMSFVQSMVKYTYDEENPYVLAVTRNDKQEEWAWNPDEMAHRAVVGALSGRGENASGKFVVRVVVGDALAADSLPRAWFVCARALLFGFFHVAFFRHGALRF